jgi:hypothetical protein
MHRDQRYLTAYTIALLTMSVLLIQPSCITLAEEAQKPERLLTMAVEYPGIEVTAGDDVSMNLTFHNKGRSGETVDVWVADKTRRLGHHPENLQVHRDGYPRALRRIQKSHLRSQTRRCRPAWAIRLPPGSPKPGLTLQDDRNRCRHRQAQAGASPQGLQG